MHARQEREALDQQRLSAAYNAPGPEQQPGLQVAAMNNSQRSSMFTPRDNDLDVEMGYLPSDAELQAELGANCCSPPVDPVEEQRRLAEAWERLLIDAVEPDSDEQFLADDLPKGLLDDEDEEEDTTPLVYDFARLSNTSNYRPYPSREVSAILNLK